MKNQRVEDNIKILNRLLRNFNAIPTDMESHIFREIYEYFLGNFALKEGQGGGEFFTPRTVVQYMVEVLKSTEGEILDIILRKLIQFNYPVKCSVQRRSRGYFFMQKRKRLLTYTINGI